MSATRVVERSTILPVPPPAVEAWHRRAGACERLTPPWERTETLERAAAGWRHTRALTAAGGGCRMTDRLEYAVPFGAAGAPADRWLIRPRIERLVAYRHALLHDDLAAHDRFREQRRLRVAVYGASGWNS